MANVSYLNRVAGDRMEKMKQNFLSFFRKLGSNKEENKNILSFAIMSRRNGRRMPRSVNIINDLKERAERDGTFSKGRM